MNSMTGYGKGVCENAGRTVTVELKSVNHRYLDLGVKMPKSFLFIDDAVRKAIGSRIARGHVDIFLTYEKRDSEGFYSADAVLAQDYVKTARALAETVGVEDDLTLAALLKVPDVMVRSVSDDDEEMLKAVTLEALDGALDALCAMRSAEGAQLKADVTEKLTAVEECLWAVKEQAPHVKEDYRERLEARIKEAVGNGYDEARILTEVALFADRSAIDEEITRLTAHIVNMRKLCECEEPVGRKMDFLVQEMNRETNTIGSKCNDLRITSEVLKIKNEIEKIREQAQNIE